MSVNKYKKFLTNPFINILILVFLYILILNIIYFTSNPSKFTFNYLSLDEKAKIIINAVNKKDKAKLLSISCLSIDTSRGGESLVDELLALNNEDEIKYEIKNKVITLKNKSKKLDIIINVKMYSFGTHLQLLPFYSQEWEEVVFMKAWDDVLDDSNIYNNIQREAWFPTDVYDAMYI